MSLSRESNFLELIEHGNPEALTLLANSPELFETGLELTLGGPEPLFHFAAYYKQQELLFDMFKLADKLIQEGRLEKSVIEAHMQILDHQGQGVLHLVAEMGSPSVLNDCLRYGAGLRAENKSHQTIQERAAVNNRLDILNHLTKLKMPLPPRDIDEIEEAELADGLDEAPLTRLYDINASSSLGNTPLHHYARGGMNDSTGEFLLANGANINALNNANKSPLRLLLMGASDSGFYLTPAQIHKATFLI
jgi:ankyrin repeat protein